MTTDKMCDNPCETCQKEGLPLLLTRYAVFPNEAGAPHLSGQLDDATLKSITLGKNAHYGLRLLRSGYVYVHDEARKLWDEYFVTADGFLTKLPPRPKQGTRPAPATEFACARNGAAPLAGVITVRNPKHATNIWIGFSNVEWTDATIEKHKDAAYRQKHMRKIVVKNGKVSPQPNTAALEQVDSLVPEFKLEDATVRKHIEPSGPFQFNSRVPSAERFKEAVKKATPEGGAAIVALDDPVGLAMEIAALMEARKLVFTNEESEAKPRFAASTISGLELAIKEQAMLNEIISGEELAEDMVNDLGPAAVIPSNQKHIERVRNPTAADLQTAADKAWKQYTHDHSGKLRFDAAAAQNWLKTYNDRLRKHDAENVAPLAKAHVAWMKHNCMANHMTCNYDDADRESGVAYTKTFVDLLLHTTDKQPSYELYLSWLNSGEFTADNLVMRALGFNQKELIEKIDKAAAPAVDLRAFPTDAVASAVAAFMEKMPSAANTLLANLLAGLSGPALKYWDDFNAGKVGTKAAAAMAAVTGKQFVRLPINGNKGQLIQAYVRQLYSLDPTLKLKSNANQLQKAVAAKVRLLEIEGVPMQAKSKLGWYVLLDREVVAGATSKNLAGQALADELANAIRTPQDLLKIDLARAAKVRGGLYAGATVLTGILMVWNYTKLLSDVENGMSHEKTEAIAKLMAGRVAIGGFVAEQLGNGLEKLGETRLRNMMGRVGAYVPRALQVLGRFAGFGVGMFLGLWDIGKGFEEDKKGNTGLSNAYFVSGAAGIFVAGAMFAVAMGWILLGPIGWIVVAIGVLIWLLATLFIETNKDNSLQEWLSRCHFGNGTDKYPDTAAHVEQYKLALAK